MNATPRTQSTLVTDTSGIAGHPRGLSTLFFTEMWERFSYYGMRALLILYMTAPLAGGGLGFAVPRAASLYGIYTASVYMTNLLGGWIADRFLGARRAVLVGGIIIAAGHFSMAANSLFSFYSGLCLIAAGTGLLKPNISVMVGSLYAEGDAAKRDAGFSIFYMGINLGAFIAPFICGYLGQRVAWHYGFAAAGVGMVLGIIQYVIGGQRLGSVGLKTKAAKPAQAAKAQPVEEQRPFTSDEKKRLVAIVILSAFAVIFFMTLEQAGSSLNLFADRLTRQHIFGMSFPSSWFQSANPIFIIIFAPIFAWIWTKLGDSQPSSAAKFAIGLLIYGASYLLLVYASIQTSSGPVSPMWLIVVYFLQTLGELCISPVGLSTVTKLAPARVVGAMMGVWFLAASIGNFLAGQAAGFFQANQEALVRLFGAVAGIAIGAGVLCAIMIPFIRKLAPEN